MCICLLFQLEFFAGSDSPYRESLAETLNQLSADEDRDVSYYATVKRDQTQITSVQPHQTAENTASWWFSQFNECTRSHRHTQSPTHTLVCLHVLSVSLRDVVIQHLQLAVSQRQLFLLPSLLSQHNHLLYSRLFSLLFIFDLFMLFFFNQRMLWCAAGAVC